MEMNFSRPTLIAACNLLAELTHSELDDFILQIGLENEIPAGNANNRQSKATALARIVIDNPHRPVETSEGEVNIGYVVIVAALQRVPYQVRQSGEFRRCLARDGFTVEEAEERFGSRPMLSLRRQHPENVDIPAADDEVHALLRKHGFSVALSHLDQAIDAHTRGNWAGANGQIRTFIEEFIDEIARRLVPEPYPSSRSRNERWGQLATIDPPFLSVGLNEWAEGNGQSFLRGFFARLHPEGSHPGLSGEDDSTFRLHTALSTARLLLKRYDLRVGDERQIPF